MCTKKAGSEYGIWGGMCKLLLKKNHKRNFVILLERGGVDPKSENHIRNVLISIEGRLVCKI